VAPDLAECFKFLETDDERSRPGRARRLQRIAAAFGPERYLVLPGGLVALQAFDDARHAYVRGLWLACIVAAQASIEHMLAGQLRMSGREGRWGFDQILKMSLEIGTITEDEYASFDGLRGVRNPYAHAREPLAAGSVERRALDAESYVDEVLERDADDAVIALINLVARPPFSLD
jgi:hypothetical protein